MRSEIINPKFRAEFGTRTRCGARLPILFGAALIAVALSVPSMGIAGDLETEPGPAQATPAGPFVAPDGSAAPNPGASEPWSVYGQATNVTQWHPAFRAAYSGPNSLDAASQSEETSDVTAFVGLRLWRGGEFWLNPEIDEGFGLSNTLGVAGFPSGEAYKVGADRPYFRMARAFFRQVFNLDGTPVDVAAAPNQFADVQSSNNVTVTLGKFSVVDIFDTNAYAHDPRADFMNWAVIDAGAFDYAADSWGYTLGGAVEWTQSSWTLRGGWVALSEIPNGKALDTDFDQYALIGEFEQRYEWSQHPGKVKLLVFDNRGYMGSYADALSLAQQTASTPDVSRVTRFASRPGLAFNLEQELSPQLGFFLRASVNNGTEQAFDFSDIDQSLSAGFALHGDRWKRPNDVVGIAAAINGLSGAARDYFAAGGLGILIGDGRLNYAPEKIAEIYYSTYLSAHFSASLDFQYVVDPAYNTDRGPVSIVGLRVHCNF
ncbi:MAG: carbohydrate porin [Thiobacillaceae bacterium]